MKPRIAITMGDPGGVGPEIIAKALVRPEVEEAVEPLVYGDVQVMESTVKRLGLKLNLISTGEKFPARGESLSGVPVVQVCTLKEPPAIGQVSPENGRASYNYIAAAARDVLANNADAICTAPISKEALHLAGYNQFPGHTEMLAYFCGQETVRMMLVGGGLNVVLQTIHVPLKEVSKLITADGVVESLRIISAFAFNSGQSVPRIAVCGLNPHAGENGEFGREEIDVISPAIEATKREGLNVNGPVPADTVYHRALEGEFDYVLAMYHDQALIPVKTLDFHGGVNVTLGLPLLRTSPDHGTAFGIAGRNLANESSMTAALLYAAKLARQRSSKSS